MEFEPELDEELSKEKRERLRREYGELGFFARIKVKRFEYKYPQYLYVSNPEERSQICEVYKKVMKDLSLLLRPRNEGDLITSFKNLRAIYAEGGAEGTHNHDRMRYMIVREELKRRGRK